MAQTLETTAVPVSEERVQEGVRSLLERGYAIVERSLSPEQCATAAGLLDDLVTGGQANEYDGTGYFIHPLVVRDGRLADFYCDPLVIAILEKLFEGEVHLMHTGARLSDTSHAPRIVWHQHRYPEEQAAALENPEARGTRPARVVVAWYLEGCTPESGPLVAYPRRYDDLVAAPSNAMKDYWDGEVQVSCPPGSAVIFTTDLWHSAIAGTGDARRHLMGAHFQGWNNPRKHAEDQEQVGPEVDAACERNPIFAGLMRR